MANYLTTDTDLTAVANAIRTKGGTQAGMTFPNGFVSAIQEIPSGGGGGSTNILDGVSIPDSSAGSNGAIYLQHTDDETAAISYLKFSISKARTSGKGVQLSELKLLDSGGNAYQWPSGTVVTSNAAAYSSSETADRIIDGNTGAKYYTSTNPSDNSPIEILIQLPETFDLDVYSKFQWYTANDEYDRDPVSFSLSISTDGSTWNVLDVVTDATIVTTRRALAYEKTFKGIWATYLKVNGAWQDLIGSSINDVNLSGGSS